VSPPTAIGSAPLDPETIAALKLEIAKPRMSADKLRKRLVPPVSGATFWRALHGQKVSKPVQDACVAMARTIRADPDKPVVFKPPFPVMAQKARIERAMDGKVIYGESFYPTDGAPYDFDPDPEVA
jgi:hypothetical protein